MASIKAIICHFVVFIALAIKQTHMTKCALGYLNSTPGFTEPAGDIFIQYGEDLSIKCIIDLTQAKGLNSNNLFFKIGNKEVVENVTKVINETAIELYVEHPEPSSKMYSCYLRNPTNNQEQAVCLNLVTIGTPPQLPDDFQCKSNNWENLTCKFHRKNDYVKTDYDISFYLPSTKRRYYNCTNRTDSVIDATTTCFWDLGTKVPYRQQYKDYVFLIKMSNRFGNETFTYNFSHFENVIPAQPSSIDIQDKTPHSAMLIWNVSRPMNTFKPGLHHRIKYISQYENTTWKEANTSIIPIEAHLQYNFELKDLKYANTLYDVRVQVKSAVAPDKEEKWSPYKAITFKTLPELPARPPRTAVGSFEIVDKGPTRDVLVFWQKIEDYEKNGPEFKYEINMTENGNVARLSDETRYYYANFSDLSYSKEYLFTITSVNAIGRSVGHSYIRVPNREHTLSTKLAFTKILLSDFIYELSWRKPSNIDIRNFTVFWCQSVRERPSICPNSLEWQTVPANTTSLKVTVPTKSNHQFAIAANTDDSSSGMIWATCTVNIKGVGKLRTVRIESVGDTFIKVSWVLECSVQIGVVTGYRIHYCIMNTPHASGCQGPKQILNVTDLDRGDYAVIENLQPYTTYQINVSVITQNKEGLPSDPLYNTTLEAAPTKPLRVHPVAITNSSIMVKWDQPEQLNGFIKFYKVVYNSTEYDTKTEKVEKEKNRTVLLTNLHGFTNYSIKVTACTLACSNYSDPIIVQTNITYPSNVKDPFFNTSTWLISWQRPDYPGGNIDFYEVLLKVTRNKVSGENTSNVTTTNYTVPNSICEPKTETEFTVLVRAVNHANIIKNGEILQTTYPGSWSKEVPYRCPGDPNNVQPWIWFGGIVGGLLIFGLIIFACKRVKDYIEGIKDIEVILPSGISSSIEKDTKYPFDERSLLPQKHGKISSGERNTIDSSFASKDVSDDSGLHNKSDEISGSKWSGSNNGNMDIMKAGNKLTKLSKPSEDEWLSDKIDGYTKLTRDNYPDNSTKYCLVGAKEPTKTNGKTPNGYVQAVLPAHNQTLKPYESFECSTLKPFVNKNQAIPPVVEKSNGYLPITSCLPGGEQPTRLLLSPNTPEDSPDDEEIVSQIKPEVKRPNTSTGYVVVDNSNVGNKFHTPLIPINVPNLQTSAIPKGYVKAAEIPIERRNTDVESTSFENVLDHANSSLAQIHSPYVAHSEINKCLTPDITKKVLSSNINPNPPISSGYVQHRIEHN